MPRNRDRGNGNRGGKGDGKPDRPQRDDADHHDHDDDEGPIAILSDGARARRAGSKPSPEAIAAALDPEHKRIGQDDLTCWNGKSALKLWCHLIGSQNIAPVARCVIGDWRWLGRLARVWIDEGLFGKELGANTLLYVVDVLQALLWALGEARRAGETAMANDLRIAVRAAVAFVATTAVPIARRHTIMLTTDKRFPRTERDEKNPEAPTSVVAGNRWTIQRGGFDGNAGSVVIRGACAFPIAWGLTREEGALLHGVMAGDTAAARSMFRHVNDGGWMLGTINVPGETVWRFVAERFTDKASMRFDGPWPNGNTKMVCGYSQLDEDGTWTSAKAWPEGYEVREDGEYIVVRDNKGEVAVPRLGGPRLWVVELEGDQVRFDGG